MRSFASEKMKLFRLLYAGEIRPSPLPNCVCVLSIMRYGKGPLSVCAVFRKTHVRGCHVYVPIYETDSLHTAYLFNEYRTFREKHITLIRFHHVINEFIKILISSKRLKM